MNLLIVDDEYYCVENIRKKLLKNCPEFEHIYCAYHMKAALDFFAKDVIDIMICDIEMPGGSGLELLDHIRQRQLDTVCIFLTAYAKFEYISRAMKLSSMDYLLKPVDEQQLLASVRKAQEQARSQQKARLDTLHAGYWKDSVLSLVELFWLDVFSGVVPTDQREAESELKYRKIPPEVAKTAYLLVLLQCNPAGDRRPVIDRELYEFTLKNILREFFYEKEELAVVVRLDGQNYFLLLPAGGRSSAGVAGRCREALLEFGPHFPNTFRFYVASAPAGIGEIRDMSDVLRQLAKENVSEENEVVELAEYAGRKEEYPAVRFPQEAWSQLLMQGKTAELLAEAERYLSGLKRSGSATRETLFAFYYRFLQLLLTGMEYAGKKAREAFEKQILTFSADEMCSSFSTLRRWVGEVLSCYRDGMTSAGEQATAVAKVQAYILGHLGEEMSRESLAAMVYLTPDYLSHIFKDATGSSVTGFIINERIKEAERLLAGTDKSIRDIAIACGFPSISYFSKQFRRATGVSPREFRKGKTAL